MFKILLLPLVFLIFLTGCSPFGGLNKKTNALADGLNPKELYQLAEDNINAGTLDEAIKQYELILALYPASKYAIQARLDIAYNLFKRKKYLRATLELDNFIDRYPSNPSTPYAYYLRGVIAEEKSKSILDNIITDNAQRDVQSVRDAYQYYVLLIDKFPDSKYSKDASIKLNLLKNTLAKHEFYIAIYYTKIGSNIAAINRVKYIIENFPNSPSSPDSLHLMALNYDAINAKKLAADVRIILTSSYPNYSPNYSIN